MPSSYEALREGAALVATDDAVLDMEGKDAFDFLHRMVANDVKGVEPGHGRRSLLLDLKGHCVADLAILRTGEQSFTLLLARSALPDVEAIFGKYGIVSDFQLAPAQERVLTVQGPRAIEALTLEGPIAFARELDHVKTPVGGVTVRLVRHDRTGRGGLDLVLPESEVAKVEAAIRAPRASAAELDLVRLEAGRATFGRDFGPDTIPQEAQLEAKEEDALSFEKGCFFGQEVVARLRFRGHVNRLLVPLVVEGEAAPGAPLAKDGKEVGRLTSVATSPALGKKIALGYVRREHASPGVELETDGARARVVSRGWSDRS